MIEKRAIIFDMDGLLLDTERIAYRAFGEAATSLGLAMSPDIYSELIGRRTEDIVGVLSAFYGKEAPVETMAERIALNYGRMIDAGPIPLRPCVSEVLDFIDEQGWLRAVATSTRTAHARFKLEKAGILGRLDRVVGGELVSRGKPFPDIYWKAAEPFGLPHGDIIVLEDSRPGVQGAAAAGMRAVMIPDLQTARDQERKLARAIFTDLGEFVRAARKGCI